MDVIQLVLMGILSYCYRKLCVVQMAPDVEQNCYTFWKHFLKVTHLSGNTENILEVKCMNGWSCSCIFVDILYKFSGTLYNGCNV